MYQAVDRQLGRVAALKVLHRAGTADAPTDGLMAEARRQAALNHLSLPTVYEVGQWGDRCYLAMEYVTGEPLAHRLATGPLETETAVSIAVQVAGALQAIHAAGFIHGDLSSANVMLLAGGGVKVLDLGLARPLTADPAGRPSSEGTVTPENPSSEGAGNLHVSAPNHTRHSPAGTSGYKHDYDNEHENVVGLLPPNNLAPDTVTAGLSGTAPYLAPEVLRGEGRDQRSDIFALGVLLYEMVAGHHPFARSDVAATLAAILQEEPPPLSQSQPGAPLELERVVRRALAKRPADRYQTAAELLADLHRLGRQLQAVPGNAAASTIEPAAESTPSTPAARSLLGSAGWALARAFIRRHKPVVLSISLIAFILATADILFLQPINGGWIFMAALLAITSLGFSALALSRHFSPAQVVMLPPGSAFRGLWPFLEGDRAQFFGRGPEVQGLVERVTATDSRFVVLMGDSGCGKTSLLRAGLLPRLWEEGYLPVYCRSYQDPLATITTQVQRLSQVAPEEGEPLESYLRRVCGTLDTTVVLVCDQGEEFFVHFQTVAEREPFLSFVSYVVNDPQLRVHFLLSIRSDFLHLVSSEFAGRIEEPLASRRLFHLRNFSEGQAEEVIRRSAEQAGLPFEAGFCRYLAQDLAAGRTALPSELQIIGDQLQNRRIFTVTDYRRAGGKEQLAHSFLEDVIRLSGNPPGASLLLNSLISEENTRLTLPVREIARRTQLGEKAATELLGLLVQARMVREIQETSPWRYELVHEYLIHRINEVTGKVMDARQRANRLLRQYLANYQVDPHSRIPISKLWFIRRHADREGSENEKKLLRKSLWTGLLRVGALLMSVAVATTAVTAYFSVSEHWESVRLKDGHTAAVRQAVFSPNGQLLATCGEDGLVIVWDFARRQPLSTLRGCRGWVTSVAFSPDGRWLAFGGDGNNVVVWDVRQSVKAADLSKAEGQVRAISFSPDGQYLVIDNDGSEHSLASSISSIWRVAGWVKVHDYPECLAGACGSLLFINKGRFILSQKGEVLNLDSGHCEGHQLKAMVETNWNTISPDGALLASVTSAGSLYLWDFPGQKLLYQRQAHQDHGRSVAFSPDGRLIASAAENIALWDATSLTLLARLEYAAIVWSVVFSPDGRWLVSAHSDGSVLVWDVAERKRAANLSEHSAPVRGVTYSPDGKRVASASDDNSVIVWDIEQKKKATVLVGHPVRATGAVFVSEGRRLASCDFEGTVILWDTLTGRPLRVINHQINSWISSYTIAASPNGRWVGTTCGVYDLSTGCLVLPFFNTTGSIYSLSFSPDGRQLAVMTHRGLINLFEVGTWELQEEYRTNQMALIAVSFSPDGHRLATGDDEGRVCLWQTKPLRCIARLGRHAARVKAVAFSPDGQRVASAGDDQTIALWDVARRRLITRIDTHTAPVLSLAFSPDGKRLVSGEHDSSVRLHTLHRTLWGFPLD